MGVDHVVDLDCEAKRALGVERIVQLLKSRSQADTILAMSRERGDTRPPEQVTFKVAVQRPTGVETKEVSVATLYAQAAALDRYRSQCTTCPANGASRDSAMSGFGCVRYINYPIQRSTEEWLFARLPGGPATTAGHLFSRALGDFKWDGGPVAKLRVQGKTFFESSAPLQRRWPSGAVVTSDQMFHMMFHVGHLGASHCLMLALFLGALPHSTSPDVLGDRGLKEQALATAHVAREEGQIEQLATFLRALVAAARLDVRLLVDG
jgi:hypothetical protein